MLILDGDTQSSQGDERIYHETLVHPAMAGAADHTDVLILGGGEGATLREVLRVPDVRRCTMVDIDGLVVDLSKKYLPEWSDGAFDDPRARVIVGDALAFMREDSRSLRRGDFGSHRTARRFAEQRPLQRRRLRTHQGAPGRRRHLRAAGEHGRVSQRVAALQDGAHAAAVTTGTSPRSSRTCRRSIPTGRFWRAAIASTWPHSTPARSTRTARSCAARISSTTR